jgi:hypothetical protein
MYCGECDRDPCECRRISEFWERRATMPTLMDDLKQPGKAASDQETPDRAVTTAHLLATVNAEHGHAARHMHTAMETSGAARQYNLVHASRHLASAIEHSSRLTAHVKRNYPEEGKEIDNLEKMITPPMGEDGRLPVGKGTVTVSQSDMPAS